jgi:glycine/D-amino acid oxidase-like deaminating enzyme
MTAAMCGSELHAEYDAGDVLVVGAGASGLLTASSLASRGLDCTLVEAAGLGAQQSNHSHGYLHSGYAYLDARTDFIRDLQSGSRAWSRMFRELGVVPVTETSTIGFSAQLNALAATTHWRRAGLAVAPTAPPTAFRGDLAACFCAAEPTYCFSPFFATRSSHASDGVTTRQATVSRLLRDGDRIVGVEVELEGRLARLRADRYVLTAGASNERLIASATNHRGRVVARTSYMLVVQAPDLPTVSAIFPENELYGLFLASRRHDGETVWLVSNYISFSGGEQTEIARRLWLQGTLRTLRRATEVLDMSDVKCGYYVAPKLELRQQPAAISSYGIDTYGLENVWVAAPTKLTLVPPMAEELAEQVATAPSEPRHSTLPRLASKAVEPQPEMWQAERLALLDDFCTHYGLRP